MFHMNKETGEPMPAPITYNYALIDTSNGNEVGYLLSREIAVGFAQEKANELGHVVEVIELITHDYDYRELVFTAHPQNTVVTQPPRKVDIKDITKLKELNETANGGRGSQTVR